ncbi:MAG: NUDIX domain-containing protein [Candidatus Moranbacteria bacterium]|nr:NUDIX domain-containing protein [Candidatus Moranbacteria bacterium]
MENGALKDTTLLFLVRREEGGAVSDICLSMKKRGFGTGKWNGVGGKLEPGESIEDAARRETEEEIGVRVGLIRQMAQLEFRYGPRPDWDQLVHVFFAEDWEGEPEESEEMRPEWYAVADIPFGSMWPDDAIWLPEVLAGKPISGRFRFGEGETILEHEILPVTEA